MSEFAHADGDTYHATPGCAPAGADRVLAEFALEADMEPCGVCGPREPRNKDFTVSEAQLVEALADARSIQGAANRLGTKHAHVMEAMGQYGYDDLVGGDGPSVAEFDGRNVEVGD